jgi:SAM-dependent methyltransferase
LIEGSAEAVPLPDDSFDIAISEYGASLWCDPEAWIPEAARLLRPGGWLWFLTNTPLVMLTMHDEDEPSGETLALPQFGMRRFQWSDGSVEFHLPHGELIALLGRCGFTVQALHELQAPEGATTRYEWVTPQWAHRWPSEEIWVARLDAPGERASAGA